MSTPKRAVRSRTDRMLAGVCGGLAQYFGVESKMVRLLAIVLGLVTGGAAIIGYIILMVVMPEEDATDV